jgi:hypothetical protein
MARVALFVVGLCLALFSVFWSVHEPALVVHIALALQHLDGRLVLLAVPATLAAIASFLSIPVAWAFFRSKRTLAMAATLFLGAIVPPALAVAGGAAVCSFACVR